MEAIDGLEFFDDVERNGGLFRRSSNVETVEQDEEELLWAAIERLPSQKRMNTAIMRRQAVGGGNESEGEMEAIDVRKLDRTGREALVKNALATIEQDNYNLLAGIKERLDIVGISISSVEVRFESLKVSAEVQQGKRALPTLFNFVRDTLEGCATSMGIFRPQKHSLVILNNVYGVVKPGRMTLLLGPPAAGKSTLLKTLAGKLDTNLKKVGKVTYNGHELNEFYIEATSAYVGQTDSHIGDLTVRETLDIAARFQGASDKSAGYLKDLSKREKEMDIRPRTVIDAFMKASSVAGKKHSLVTDYVLRLLGIHVCADTVVGNDMLRGVSGGQKKRVTTGEMIVGPRKTLFMDEISTGLDSSTTFQIMKCIRNFVHQMQATVVIALLQPAPETFNLFDDVMLISEGHIIYQGPRESVVEFFESLGFSLPPRKGVADFLQEVTSWKDQAQYWSDNSRPYVFLTVPQIAEAFKQSQYGKSIFSTLSLPYDKTKCHPFALASTKYAVSTCELFKACFSREFILIKRHRSLYIFKAIQAALVGAVTCTMFIRTRLHPTNELYGQLYQSCLFFGLTNIMFNGISELPIFISRLPVFYKHRENSFHPAWAYCIPNLILRIPYSIIESLVWSCVVYYSVGFAPGAGSFFRYMFLLFVVHQMALGLFRLIGALARDLTIANTFGSVALQLIFLLCGFLLPKDEIKPWWAWGFWVSPLQYAQTAISVNEFTAPRWKKMSAIGNDTVGNNILKAHSLPTTENWYWIGIGALTGYFVVFNSLVIVAMAYLHPIGKAQTVLSDENTEENGDKGGQISKSKSMGKSLRGMILPFQPLSLTFHNVNYFVDMPKEMKVKGFPEKRLQLLSNVSGVFRPGVLTALVGSSGAGKTTLMDVLAGRKTGGYIEGDIKISGFPKVQETFVRVSGYVEQNDIHSPQVTVEESLRFSAYLWLSRDVTMEP